jgi:hypothetical protein
MAFLAIYYQGRLGPVESTAIFTHILYLDVTITEVYLISMARNMTLRISETMRTHIQTYLHPSIKKY